MMAVVAAVAVVVVVMASGEDGMGVGDGVGCNGCAISAASSACCCSMRWSVARICATCVESRRGVGAGVVLHTARHVNCVPPSATQARMHRDESPGAGTGAGVGVGVAVAPPPRSMRMKRVMSESRGGAVVEEL